MARNDPHPPNQDYDISELQENVLLLLEAAGLPTATNDAIMKIIEQAEECMWMERGGGKWQRD